MHKIASIRYGINRIATKVVELSNDGSFEYLGDYDYYVEKKQELIELAEMKAAQLASGNKSGLDSTTLKTTTSMIDKDAKKRERQIRRQIEDIEQKMADFDEQITYLEAQLCDPAIFSDHEKALALQLELDNVKEAHEVLELEWLELQEELENN